MNMEDLTIPQPVGFHRAETDGPAETDSQQCRRFVVGLDFGTTFSSVSVACVQQTDDGKDIEVQPFDIWSVCNYPDSPSMYNDNRADVPTECFYPAGAPYREPIMHLNMTYHEDGTSRKKSAERESNESSVDCQVDGNMEHADGEPDFMDIDMPLGDYYWGYEVRKALEMVESPEQTSRHLSRFKLLLDEGDLTRQIRDTLTPKIDQLENEKIIGNKRETDIIADYLERVFQHTKEQMKNRHEYKEGEPVEFALCIPAIWTRKACRTMQQAMTAALHRVRFITDKFHDVSNLFIVHEPEAASAYVLAHNKKDIMAGESFVLLDAGGGTVDAITYKVASNLPLRLEREAVAPSGALCGSSYLNEDFRKFIERRLSEETYLQNLDAKIDMIMEQFENDIKRNFNPARNTYAVRVMIDNLRESREKGFKANKMHITKKDMTEVFDGCLKRTAQLMLDQILQAEANNIFVKKVVLIGGFAASHALSQHLNNELREYSDRAGRAIQLRVPKFPGTAVASGAVLCALKKEDAPARTIFSSYGLKITEPFDNANPAHVEQIKSRQPDPNDRQPCIRDTILWFVNKGDVLSSKWEYTLPVNLTFTEKQDFTFTQVLYVSDRNHRSSYREDHEENEGKEEAGRIDVDMTYLKDKGLVQCTKGRGRRPYYLIEFDLVIIVDGRNLTFEARHPYGSEGDHERGQISIAAAFLENPDAASAP